MKTQDLLLLQARLHLKQFCTEMKRIGQDLEDDRIGQLVYVSEKLIKRIDQHKKAN